MRRPREKSRCANGRMDDYRFVIAVGRWPGRRFQAQFQLRQRDPGRPKPRNKSRPRRERITPGGRTIASCAHRCRCSRKCPVEIAQEMFAWQAAEKMAARKLWKSRAVEKSKNDFPPPLGNPANPAGFPLSHSLDDCERLTNNRTFHLLRKGDTSNVVRMGTFLMSVDNLIDSD